MSRFSALALSAILLASCSAAPAAPALPVDGDNTYGAATAQVQLLEYGDYQCPACSFYHTMVKQVMDRYQDRVSFTFRHFPLEQLHKNALISSEAAEAAGEQGKYWEMHNRLYDAQKEWSDLPDATPTFVGYAREMGLDAARFETDLRSNTFEAPIRASYQRGVALGVNSTPTFFLNGQKIQTPRTYGAFQALIDAELQKSGAPAVSPAPVVSAPSVSTPAPSTVPVSSAPASL